jgi:hypothetical protein
MGRIRKAWQAAIHFFDEPEGFEPVGVPRGDEITSDYGWVPLLGGGAIMIALAVFVR